MENKEYPKVLYHYASMEKAASILKYKNIRLSDITKSNDVNEMSIFFPGLFDEMLNIYDKYGELSYEFTYKKKYGRMAFSLLVNDLKTRIENEFKDGSISTFAICLSEERDLLSQWRGYANDGKGLCLGFSVDELLNFAGFSASTGFSLEQVEYLSKEKIGQWIRSVADNLFGLVDFILCTIAEGRLFYTSSSEFDEALFDTLYYNILSIIEESIKIKADGFKEEKEWRFFIKNSLNKEQNEEKLYNSIGMLYEGARIITSRYVAKNIDFHIKDADIVPFVNLGFELFSNNLICEVICGPNNTIREKDLEIFLRKHGYNKCQYSKSNITYIVR